MINLFTPKTRIPRSEDLKILMVMDKDVILRLPIEWQGLFSRLLVSEKKATLWYEDAMGSMYGHQPSWYKLLKSLAVMDPYIEDSNLVFKPRLLHLSTDVLRMFLAFMIKTSYIIPDVDIKLFVETHVKHTENNGQATVYNLLKELYKTTKYEEIPVSNSINVVEQDEGIEPVLEETDVPDTRIPTIVTAASPDVIVLDDTDDELEEPPTKRQRTGSVSDVIIVSPDDIIPDIDQSDLSDKLHSTSSMDEEDRRGNDVADNVKEGVIVNENISTDKAAFFNRIKEAWQNDILDTVKSDIEKMATFSATEMTAFCLFIDFSTLSESLIETICQHMSEMENLLSYTTVTCLLTFALCERVKQLSQSASRKLSGAVTLCLERFPKQTIESVLVPCFKTALNLPQCELICRITKESFTNGNRTFLMQKLLALQFEIDDNNLTFLQTIVESGCDFNEESFLIILGRLDLVALKFAKNKLFGKLLLGLINKYNKLLTGKNKTLFETLVDKHSTFLKKTIINSLKKMKI